MKTKFYAFWKVLLIGFVALPLSAADSKEAPSLQVKIETPTVFDLMQERDIKEAFLAQIDVAFHRAGFEGRIAEIDDIAEASAEIPLLKLRLMDWEKRRSGFVECRFTAELITMDGAVSRLGSFHGQSMSWGRDDRFSVSKAFEDAANSAIRDLYRDIEKLDTANADHQMAR